MSAKLFRPHMVTIASGHARPSRADWGPIIVAAVLFVLLTPGFVFQRPGKNKVVEFSNFRTSPMSIVVHTVIQLWTYNHPPYGHWHPYLHQLITPKIGSMPVESWLQFFFYRFLGLL